MSAALTAAPPPLLSFCIPTYNRSATLLPLVRRVLQTPSADIEVVVLDNGSTDDTLAQLATIDDSRLVVRSNGSNRGVIYNVVKVLAHGSGRYCALLLDKDFLDPALVPDFLDFLRREAPACGLCIYNGLASQPPQLFEIGEAALRGVAYSCHHPTGYFFRSADLSDIDIVDRFTNFDQVGHFPFEFIQAELCLRDRAAIYHAPLFSPEILQLKRSAKSFGTNAAKEDAFFSPKGRLKMAVHFAFHIGTLPIAADLRRQLILDRFVQGLRQSTLDYRGVMGNESVCEHYHIATRTVGTLEMLRTAWWFYLEFTKQAHPCSRKELRLSRASFLAETFRTLLQAVERRLGRRFA